MAASLRSRQGSPTERDVPEAWLQEGLSGALRRYSRRRGPTVLTTVVGHKDVAVYSVPKGAVMVLDAFWNLSSVGDDSDLFSAESVLWETQAGQLAGLDLFENPSLLYGFYAKARALRERFAGVWEQAVAPTGGTLEVRLMPPVKTEGGTVYLVYRKSLADVQHVPENDIDPFLDAAMAEIYQIRGARASVVTQVSFGGANVTFGQKFYDLAKEHRTRFEARVPEPFGPTR